MMQKPKFLQNSWWVIILFTLLLLICVVLDISATTVYWADRVVNRHGTGQYNEKIELRSIDDSTTTDYYDTTNSDGEWGLLIEANTYLLYVDSARVDTITAIPDVMGNIDVGFNTTDTIKFKGTVIIDSGVTFTTSVLGSALAAQRADTAAVLTGAIDSAVASQRSDSALVYALYSDSSLAAQRADTADYAKTSADSARACNIADTSRSSQRSDSALTYSAYADTSLASQRSDTTDYLSSSNYDIDTLPSVDTANITSLRIGVIRDSVRFEQSIVQRINVDDASEIEKADQQEDTRRMVTHQDIDIDKVSNGTELRLNFSDIFIDTMENVAVYGNYYALTAGYTGSQAGGGLYGQYFGVENKTDSCATVYGIWNLVRGGKTAYGIYSDVGGELGTSYNIYTTGGDTGLYIGTGSAVINNGQLIMRNDSIKAKNIDCDSIGGFANNMTGNIDSALSSQRSDSALTYAAFADTVRAANYSDSTIASQRSDSALTYAAFGDTSRASGYSDSTIASQRSDSALTYSAFSDTARASNVSDTSFGASRLGGIARSSYGELAGTQSWTGVNTFSDTLKGNAYLTGDTLISIYIRGANGYMDSAGVCNYADTTIASQRSDSALIYAAYADTARATSYSDSSNGTLYLGGAARSTFGELAGDQTWTGKNTFSSDTVFANNYLTGDTLISIYARGVNGYIDSSTVSQRSDSANTYAAYADTARATPYSDSTIAAQRSDSALTYSAFADSARASVYSDSTIASQRSDSALTYAAFADTGRACVYADSTITAQRSDSAKTWAAFADTARAVNLADTAGVTAFSDSATGALYLEGLSTGASGESLAVCNAANTWSSAQSFSNIITVSDTIKGSDLRLTGVFMSSSDTALVLSADDANIHGNLTVRESLYVTEGAVIHGDFTVDDSFYVAKCRIDTIKDLDSIEAARAYIQKAEIDTIWGLDTLETDKLHANEANIDTLWSVDTIDYAKGAVDTLTAWAIKMNGLLRYAIGHVINGDTIVVNSTDTVEVPVTGDAFVDTTDNDTLRIYLNSAWRAH